MTRSLRIAALAPLLLSLACEAEPEPETFDPEAVLAEATDYEANGYERLDAGGLVTEHDATGVTISEIWANSIGAEVFRTIDVTDLTQVVEMPRGAVFIKVNYHPDGTSMSRRQILAKFEEGYHPAGGDWFFAMVDDAGEPIDGAAGKGVEVVGCVDCHGSMGMNTDFVIGLPADQQAP